MENKKKKKCCSNFQSARLSSWTQFALFFSSLIFVFLIACLMVLNIFFISSFTYKEIYKLVDLDEFNEIIFAENNIENFQLQFENTFKNSLLSIVNLYIQLNNETLKDSFYRKKNYDFNLTFWNGTNDYIFDEPKKNIIFTCNNNDDDNIPCINIDDDNYNFYSYLGIYLENIFYNKKVFMNNSLNGNIMHLLTVLCPEGK